MFRNKNLYVVFVVSLIYNNVYSQILDTRQHVDTLTVAERLSLHVNVVDWLMLVPSIGVEYDVGRTNWNRWAVGIHLRGNIQSSHTFNPGMVYNLAGARVEARNYWRTRQIGYNQNFGRHTRLIDKLFSMRRVHVKHPLTTYYRGAYVSYNTFSMLFGKEGRQGSAMTLGFTYGIVRPLYVYSNGNSIDFELGVSAGVAYARYDSYRHDREGNCYPVTDTKPWHIVPHPVLSDLRAGFVYRFGKYPVTRKYRWRFDCDEDYNRKIDSLRLDREKRDGISEQYMSLLSEYEHLYDSIAGINKSTVDSLRVIRNSEMKDRKGKEAKLAEEKKKSEKAARLQEKADVRERKAKEREARRKQKAVSEKENKNGKKEEEAESEQ